MIHSYDTTGQTWDNNSKKINKCPVCDGKGLVPSGWRESSGGTWTSAGTALSTCHGCDGKGWVTV